MTIEELAAFSQRELESIRDEMATRAEVRSMEGTILRAVEGVGQQLASYASRLSGEFERLSDRVHGLENRIIRDDPSHHK